MSELYERLLAEARKAYEVWAPPNAAPALGRLRLAVVAVLELHKPTEALGFGELCEACSIDSIDFPLFVSYPCNTVRAIARALDVPIGDRNE